MSGWLHKCMDEWMILQDCQRDYSGYDDDDYDHNDYGCTSRYPWEKKMAEDRMAGGFVTVCVGSR